MNGPGFALHLYRMISPLLARLVEMLGPVSPKMRRGLAERRGLMPRLLAAAPRLEGCFWFHATSVGEYEQARPLIRRLRDLGQGPICVTHFSPSGAEYARRNPEGDFHDYLPLDRPGRMLRLVRAWRPRAVIFVKYDCWPNLVMAAHREDVPVFLFSAALPAASGRLSRPARPFFRSLFDLFTHIGTGNAADRDRFIRTLGVGCPVSVTGDSRAEQVIERFEQSADGPLASMLRGWGRRRLVLGSTWPPDEAIWLPVLRTLLSDVPGLKIVLVPHEPHPERIAGLQRALDGSGVRSAVLSEWESDGSDRDRAACLLVDRVGVLAEIYHAGDLAYVGGSFTTGVHSTLEPAVAGMPVLFGPRISNAEEALSMLDSAAGRIVRNRTDAFEAATKFLGDADARRRAGERAREIVLRQRGAARRSVEVLLDQVS